MIRTMEKVLWKRVVGKKRELLVVAKPFDASIRHRPLEYSDQQRVLGRPLSPSVTIYKQSIPAISSITNRICGVALSLGFGVAAAAACVGEDIPMRIHEAQDSIPGFVYVSRFAVAYPLVYHFLSGTRRMVSHCMLAGRSGTLQLCALTVSVELTVARLRMVTIRLV